MAVAPPTVSDGRTRGTPGIRKARMKPQRRKLAASLLDNGYSLPVADFSARTFVGENNDSIISTTIYPDNRPKDTAPQSMSREQINQRFEELYKPHDHEESPEHLNLGDSEGRKALRAIVERLCQENQFVAAMKNLERCVHLNIEARGLRSDAVRDDAFQFILRCNKIAMAQLKISPAMAFQILAIAEHASRRRGILRYHRSARLCCRALTLNNLACYHKSRKDYRVALPLLKRALKIELTTVHCGSPASTHLNICTVLSAIGSHTAALSHAIMAQRILQLDGHPLGASNVYIMALHNQAVEEMWLHRFEAAMSTFGKALQIVDKQSPLRSRVEAGMSDAREKVKRLRKNRLGRRNEGQHRRSDRSNLKKESIAK